MKIGDNDVLKIYFGDNEISKIYLGNNVIYESDSNPTPDVEDGNLTDMD